MAVKTISQLTKKASLTGTEEIPLFDSEGNAGKTSLSSVATQLGSVDSTLLALIVSARLIPSIVGSVPEFDSGTYYAKGNFVIHDGNLYQALFNHECGVSWSDTAWDEVSLMSKLTYLSKALDTPAYDATATYAIGDKFLYNGKLCKVLDPITPDDTLEEDYNFKYTTIFKEQADPEYVRTIASMSANCIWKDLNGDTRYTSGKLGDSTFKNNTELQTLLACSVTGTTLKDCFSGADDLRNTKCYCLAAGVTDMSGMFLNGGNPGKFLRYFDSQLVTTMANMFNGARAYNVFMCAIPVLAGGTACTTTDMFKTTYLTDLRFPKQSQIKLASATDTITIQGGIFSSVSFADATNLTANAIKNIINALCTFGISGSTRYLVNTADNDNTVNMTFTPTITLSDTQKTLMDNYYANERLITTDEARTYWTGLITAKNWTLS